MDEFVTNQIYKNPPGLEIWNKPQSLGRHFGGLGYILQFISLIWFFERSFPIYLDRQSHWANRRLRIIGSPH